MSDVDIIIVCPNMRVNQLILDYIEDCEDDFKLYCKNIGVKINYMDVDRGLNLIEIE